VWERAVGELAFILTAAGALAIITRSSNKSVSTTHLLQATPAALLTSFWPATTFPIRLNSASSASATNAIPLIAIC
jgi:hypothetical protein